MKKGGILLSNSVLFFLGITSIKGQEINKAVDSARMKNIDEVIVVAYGKVKKSNYTGSVSTISSGDIDLRPVSSVTKVLQGQVPGVQIVSSSGQPGSSPDIRIRGVGSVSASSDPLYIVDGAPYDGNINAISPNDIASISVLKDATASSLYGSRGANGIIIITTKSGKRGQPRINFNMSQGYSARAVKDYDQVSTDQYFELTWEAMRNGYLSRANAEQAARMASNNLISRLGINPYGAQYPNPVGNDGKIVPGATPLWNDNWKNVLQRTGARNQIDLDISGGTDKGSYFFSLGYLNDEGIAIESNFKRYNARLKVDSKVKDWLNVGANLAYSNSLQNAPKSDDSSSNNVILMTRLIPSFYPYYERNDDGSYKLDKDGKPIYDFGTYRASGGVPNNNMAATLPLDKNQILEDNFSGKGYLEAIISPTLQFRSTFSLDLINRNETYYTNPLIGTGVSIGGSVDKKNTRQLSYTTSNILTYSQKFGDHRINLLGGQEFYHREIQLLSGSKTNFPLPNFYEPDAGSVIGGFGGRGDKFGLLSFLGKAEYEYNNTYFLSSSVRSDGSSRFSKSNRWGTFWSVGGAWKASNEAFVKDLNIFDQLTLRASYGGQGNDNLETYYAYQSLYKFYSNLEEAGLTWNKLGTPNLKWETNLNLNIGLEFSILQNRITANIEYFNRKSKDLLFIQPLAPSTGFTGYNANIGEMKNTGFEFTLQTTPIRNDNFTWNLDLNLSTTKNKITKLPNGSFISGNKLLQEGGSIYDFFIPTWMGVNEENGAPQWKYIYEKDGKTVEGLTSDYSQATKSIQGSSLPDLIGGLSTSLAYKDFDLSALLTFSIGGKILDRDYMMILSNGSNPGRAWSTEILNRWTPENTKTDIPILSTTNNNWTSESSRFLYSATYARLKNISIGYSLPKDALGKIGIEKLRIYLQGENVLTFYKHKGMDPEQAITGNTYFRYPAMKTLVFGLQATL